MKKKGPSKIAILLYFNVPKREKTVLKNSPQYISRCLNRDDLVGRTPRQNWRAVPISMVCGTGPSLWVRSAWAWAHTLQAWTSPRKTHYGKRVDVITNQANRRRGTFLALFTALLRLVLECSIQSQWPYFESTLKKTEEWIQGRAWKLLRDSTNALQLDSYFFLFHLPARRLQGNLIISRGRKNKI